MKPILHSILLNIVLLVTGISYSQSGPDDKFAAISLKLPVVTNSNRYLNIVQTGNLIYLSGKGPLKADGNYVTGKVGGSLATEQGTEAARLCAIHLLSVLKQELGSLSKVKRIVKVTGFVNSTPDFTNQPQVIDGSSLLLEEIFDDAGKHARSAVGVASLPFGWAVEVEMIVEVTP